MAIQKITDVMFVIDATGSMGSTIKAAHDKASQIAVDLRIENPDVDFRFGAVCYRDPIDSSGDIHEFQDLTDNIDTLVEFFSKIRATGGGDGPEDIVGGLTIALKKPSWRNGPKSIIFIADAPAHGHDYCGFDNHEDQNHLLAPLLKQIANFGIAFTGMSINNGCSACLAKMKEDYEKGDGPEFIIEEIHLESHNDYHLGSEKILFDSAPPRSRAAYCFAFSGSCAVPPPACAAPSGSFGFEGSSLDKNSEAIGEKLSVHTMSSCKRNLSRHYK